MVHVLHVEFVLKTKRILHSQFRKSDWKLMGIIYITGAIILLLIIGGIAQLLEPSPTLGYDGDEDD